MTETKPRFELILGLALPFFKAELPQLGVESEGIFAGLVTGPISQRKWFEKLLRVFLPEVDNLSELREKAVFIFGFDVDTARHIEENAAVLAADSARTVLGELAARVRPHSGHVTPEVFKCWMGEIKTATGVKGKELFHPARIALTGAASGPDFDKILPLMEEGAALGLCPDVRQRIERFVGV